MRGVIDFQKKHPNVRILLGEFGVIRWAPGGARWLADVVDIVEYKGWDWMFHAVGDWNGWDPTYAADDGPKNRASFANGLVETDRLSVLKKAWAKNAQ